MKFGVLEKHCGDVGCDPTQIQRTLPMPVRVTEIMFGAIATGDGEGYQRMDEEIVAAFA